MDPELAHDVLDVGAHRFDRENEHVGDLLGRSAGGQEIDDLPFARGQRALDRAVAGRATRRGPKLFHEPARHGARDRTLPCVHGLEHPGQRIDLGVLGQEPDRPGLQCQQPELLLAVTGEHDDELTGDRLEDPAGRKDAVELGHDDIHHDDVGPVIQRELHGVATVPGLGDHAQRGIVECQPDQAPSERVVIDDDDTQPIVCWHPCRHAYSLSLLVRANRPATQNPRSCAPAS